MRSKSSRCVLLAALAAGGLLAGCGYHVAGRADMLPKSVKTIAIPAFANNTARYRLTGRLPAAVTREFISCTRYQVVADPNAADAVLHGSVVSYTAYPTILDPVTSRASAIQLSVVLHITLTDRASGKVLFERNGMEVRERYEIAVDPKAYFEESDVALDRLSQDVARTLVSAILENF